MHGQGVKSHLDGSILEGDDNADTKQDILSYH